MNCTEKIRKLQGIEQSSQFDGEKKNAHNQAEKLIAELKEDNQKRTYDDSAERFEIIAEHDAGSDYVKELQAKYALRERRKQILKEMLDMWEKLGGKI